MSAPAVSVLFLCTGNSARSQMGEALMRSLGGEQIEVASAGTSPQAEVHPMTRRVLQDVYGIDASSAKTKSIDAVIDRRFDLVITVCDEAAEACPVFPHADHQLHWSFADPALAPAAEQRQAFEAVAEGLMRRIQGWLAARGA